jgi:xanthine dehydrogenase YagS FAD-binding subunit
VAKAGGIDLLDLMKEGIIRPARIVNLKSIAGLDGVETTDDGGLTIGSLVTLSQIHRSADIRARYPALAAAAEHAATPQVRNAATIGGNLLQRPRCWYLRSAHFYDHGFDPAAAVNGDNTYHAIFDTRTSPMVHASTPATALVAYGAEVELRNQARRSRTVALSDFLLPPDATRACDAAIEPGELLTRVILPGPGRATRAAYHKQTERESYDWPICDVAVVLQIDATAVVQEARIVLGWVAPTPRRAISSEAVLRGRPVTPELAREAARAAVADATPLSQNAYKVPVLEAVVRRTILAAAGRSE